MAHTEALKRLSDTDIELDHTVARPALERRCEIEADGSNHRVIAETDAAAKQQVGAVREVAVIDVAALDEGGDADGVGDAVAQLDAELEAGGAAQRQVAGAERAGALEGVASDRAGAAGIEPLVGRQLVAGGADDRAER